MNAPCYGQTAGQTEKWLRENVALRAEIGFAYYGIAKVVRPGKGRFQLERAALPPQATGHVSFYYSGKNCWHPEGQTAW